MEEIYRDVVGYEGFYKVSNLGNIYSVKRNKVLKPTLIDNGYLQVDLYKDTKHKKFGVHRLVAIAFIPNPDNLPQVNHKDEDKTNNCVYNLEWNTAQENINYGTHNFRSGIKRRKPINQYDLQGNFIKTWNSGTEIEKTLGFTHTNITKCCRDKIKTAYGYKWQYAN